MGTRRIYDSRYPYFITFKTKDNNPFLADYAMAKIVFDVIKETEAFYETSIYSYVIMPDHVHILLHTCDEVNVSDVVRNIKSISYRRIRLAAGNKMRLWQRSFDYRIKKTGTEIATALNYINNNPLKAGLDDSYLKEPYFYKNKTFISELIAKL